MASNTPRLGLYKKDPVADRNDTFNIQTMLNDNWDRIDQGVVLETEKGSANGVASLDGNAKVPTSQLPIATTTSPGAISASDKAKLDGIQPGAEVNQNAFTTIKVGATNIDADSKTDVLELVAGSNITLTPDATNDKITISTTAEPNQNAFTTIKVGATNIDADSKTDTLELVAGTGVVLTPDAVNDKVTIAASFGGNGSATTVARSDHNHDGVYVKTAGDTMTGPLKFNTPLPAGVNTSDTPDKWPNDGITYYDVLGAGLLQGQPTNYGKIMHISQRDVKFQYFFEWIHPQGGPSGSVYYRHAGEHDTVWGQWHKIWHDGNDGAGSGLDADTVDGKQASDFVWKTEKGKPNGVATLGPDGKVPSEQLSSDAATKDELTHLNINIIDMAVELETLKGATLNGVTANIFIESFQNLNDINLMNGIYDSANKRLVL
ncbi:hypothetical protein NSQ51_13395 [Geobacillus sp. FSL K6-0789]|uniref:Uncharacterized protein n=1 Tax=Geobacillus stearothermophilus TaxID=1422 RepID=A0A3L7D1X3_GEOSE|nr:hypothetical protein [Geobacillus stearothermophilus]RLQ08637.1 hypothetical protein D9549_07040 [Geobacillus stearothermophilus]RLQ10706.1 hypothetical protein D9547_07070 [Geobacillus stearothermophilus]RLQ14050.1 hypothetical protein D9548_08025 [Geobacillus stearothermophilus]